MLWHVFVWPPRSRADFRTDPPNVMARFRMAPPFSSRFSNRPPQCYGMFSYGPTDPPNVMACFRMASPCSTPPMLWHVFVWPPRPPQCYGMFSYGPSVLEPIFEQTPPMLWHVFVLDPPQCYGMFSNGGTNAMARFRMGAPC